MDLQKLGLLHLGKQMTRVLKLLTHSHLDLDQHKILQKCYTRTCTNTTIMQLPRNAVSDKYKLKMAAYM